MPRLPHSAQSKEDMSNDEWPNNRVVRKAECPRLFTIQHHYLGLLDPGRLAEDVITSLACIY